MISNLSRLLSLSTLAIVFSFIFYSCNQSNSEKTAEVKSDIPAFPEGFDVSRSDTSAISLAQEMVKAMGGFKNWNKAKFFTWNFLGEHRHFWNKETADVRIESLSNDLIILMNVKSKKGKVFVNGTEITQADSLNKYLDMGEKIWANDSYWLFLPFRIFEPGVVLKSLGEDVAQTGETADVIELTFDKGPLQGKKFHIYVDKVSRFIVQWSFYSKAENEDPTLVTDWSGYEKYRNIWLSGSRGRNEITDIAVPDSLPAHTFTEPSPVVL